MKTYSARVKACTEEHVYLDKKMRERRYKFDKYIIVLGEEAPFIKGDNVRIVCEDDFNKLFQAIKKLKSDKSELILQIEDLQNIIYLNSQEEQKAPGDQGLFKRFKNSLRLD